VENEWKVFDKFLPMKYMHCQWMTRGEARRVIEKYSGKSGQKF